MSESDESDFEDSFEVSVDSDGEQQQHPPPVQTVQLQPAPPPVQHVEQTSGQNSGNWLHDDNRLNGVRASYAEGRVKDLMAERNSVYSRLWDLQDMYKTLQEENKTLQEENKTLQAQLATQNKTTVDSLRW